MKKRWHEKTDAEMVESLRECMATGHNPVMGVKDERGGHWCGTVGDSPDAVPVYFFRCGTSLVKECDK